MKGQNKTISLFILLSVVILFPAEVFAATITLGDIVCNVRANLVPFGPFFSGLAYVVGAIMVLKGALLFKKHMENPNDSQIVKAIFHMIAGGALAALPAAVSTLQNTLGFSASSGAPGACAAGPVTPLSSAGGLDVMMQNFVNNVYGPMLNLISVISITMGLFLIFRGLLKSAKVGSDPRAGAPHAIIVNLFVGAMLVSAGGMLSTMLESLFGQSTVTSFAGINWSGITGGSANTTAINNTVTAILMFVKIVGAIAFVRGFLMIKSAVEGTGQVTVPQGMTHIIGGTMAINIGYMLTIIDKTFGTCLVNGNC